MLGPGVPKKIHVPWGTATDMSVAKSDLDRISRVARSQAAVAVWEHHADPTPSQERIHGSGWT
jgi:hypothetical protein